MMSSFRCEAVRWCINSAGDGIDDADHRTTPAEITAVSAVPAALQYRSTTFVAVNDQKYNWFHRLLMVRW